MYHQNPEGVGEGKTPFRAYAFPFGNRKPGEGGEGGGRDTAGSGARVASRTGLPRLTENAWFV